MNTKQNKNERGQGLVEYALILVLVAIVVIVAVTALGPQISGVYDRVTAALGGGGSGGGSPSELARLFCEYMSLPSGLVMGPFDEPVVYFLYEYNGHREEEADFEERYNTYWEPNFYTEYHGTVAAGTEIICP